MWPIEFDVRRFRGKKVMVFGDFMVDEYLHGSVSRISPEAPVPVVHIGSSMKRLGGAGNVVLNLRALGAAVNAVGCLGEDVEGDWLLDRLREHKVDVSGIYQERSVTTSVKTRITAKNQQMLRYDRETVRDASQEFYNFLLDRIDALLENVCAVVVSDYGKGVVTDRTAKAVIEAAKKRGIPIVVDPKGICYNKYRGATVCTPNMMELQAATGRNINDETDIMEAGRELCIGCGFQYILATRSEKGMSLICGSSGEKTDYPAVAKEVVDVTGAGDTVISVFTLGLASGASLGDCCRLANLAASVVVSKFGAASVSLDELVNMAIESSKERKKIFSIEEAAEKAELLRQQGIRVVFTNGCFDIVHAGHVATFRKARELGGALFLGLNSDASVQRLKGKTRPVVSQNDRAALLEAIDCIDYIVIFDDDTPEKLIHAIRPDVLVKGGDWQGQPVAGGDFVKSNGGEVYFVDLKKGLSTTIIIQRILEAYGGKI